ncbi:MAG TPA: adenosine deaminase, partial [Anaerolineaceae bacterium]|nr:adenosine deaminase [Anaerolineaceae bacterium]
MISKDLPLIDLHKHLDGSIRLETILDLGLKHNLPLPATTLDGLRPFVQVSTPQPGVMKFIEKFKWMTGVLVDYDACRRVAYENIEDAFLEGIDYIELRYSPWFMAEAHHLSPEGVIEAVSDGIQTGEQDFNIKVNQLGI